MQKIAPCLWFDCDAEEAVDFYLSVFENARVTQTLLHTDASPGETGTVLAICFELNGQEFMALNGGSNYAMTPAISLFVQCDTQAEIDRYWDTLLDGGEALACGWVTDRFGLTWQIAPAKLPAMLRDPDPVKANRTMIAMRGMIKLDLAELERVYNGD